MKNLNLHKVISFEEQSTYISVYYRHTHTYMLLRRMTAPTITPVCPSNAITAPDITEA